MRWIAWDGVPGFSTTWEMDGLGAKFSVAGEVGIRAIGAKGRNVTTVCEPDDGFVAK